MRTLVEDYRRAGLSGADRSMLDYAAKLTASPSEVTKEDVDGLRSEGFDDRAIHDICAVAAYFAYVNRIADGLGVELEGDSPDRRADGEVDSR
ncbi:MAG: peroxidase [bacterium]|nr:peroxidase [bacterium]